MNHPVESFLASMSRLNSVPKIYPGYIGSYIKRLLLANPDPEDVIRDVGAMDTIGDCKYAITIKDFNGAEYRITIESIAPERASVISDEQLAGAGGLK